MADKKEKHPLEEVAAKAADEAQSERDELRKRVEAGEGEFDASGRYYLDGVDVTAYLPSEKSKREVIDKAQEQRQDKVEVEPTPDVAKKDNGGSAEVSVDNTDKKAVADKPSDVEPKTEPVKPAKKK